MNEPFGAWLAFLADAKQYIASFMWCLDGVSGSTARLGTGLLICWALTRVFWRGRHLTPSKSTHAAREKKQRWHGFYQDPLRFAFLPPQGISLANSTKVEVSENEKCICKVLAMHRPTHEPWREKDASYPFGWHLAGRRRLWEIRIQLQFKETPQSQIYFGIMLGKYVPISFLQRQIQKTLVAACRSIVGDFYHSPGDDPSRVNGELEPPTFVMPIWAFDQMVVSDPGEEPDLAEDLEGFGIKRTDGLSKYIKAVQAATDTFSKDKVYTFCFWGVSQFLDCMRWEICGGVVPMRMNFNNLCGAPPIYVAMYEMPSVTKDSKERRHLLSLKKHFFHIAMWSNTSPPPREVLEQFVSHDQEARKGSTPRDIRTKRRMSCMSNLVCWDQHGDNTWIGG